MKIDQNENRELTDEEVERYFNELHSLEYLAAGLNLLNAQVGSIEAGILERNKGLRVEMFGNGPGLEGVPQDLVACAYHWYSVTVCNYVLLVGWLLNKESTKAAKKYQDSVLGNVLRWRNKVGAHFTQADPHRDDSPAVLAQSVMFPVGFRDDAFYSPPFTLTLSSEIQENPNPGSIADWRWRLLRKPRSGLSRSGPEITWSLTRTHKKLSDRYSHLAATRRALE